MLALKIIVFVLVISNGVLGRDTRRGNVRHRPADDEYKYNHPPAQENYEAIPVAVVYEDEFNRVDKSVKSAPKNNVEQVDKEPLKSDSSITENPNDFEVSSDKHIEKLTDVVHEEPKVTTYRPQKEQHIPVAVVYDQEPAYYQKPRPNRNRVTNKRRKNQRPVSDEKQTAVEDAGITGSYVNGHTGPITTTKQVENLNTRRKTQRPIPEEKQTTIEDNISSSVRQRENAPSALTIDKTEEKLTAAQVDTPTSDQGNKYATTVSKIELPVGQTENALSAFVVDKTEENQTTAQVDASTSEQGNEYATSVSETKKPEQLNALRKIQRPVQGNRQKIDEDNIRSSVQRNENTPSIYSADKSAKLNSRTEDVSQLSNRGNPTRVREVIPIIQSENLVFSQSGNFQYSYEGGDGTKAFEKGELKTFDDENAGEAVSGGFSYTAKDGNEYSLSYTADENGYRPIGAHLPTPPPIPPAIARALAYLATKPTPEPVTESLVEYDQ